MANGQWEEESRPVLSKVSVVVAVVNGRRIVHFIGAMARESTMEKMSAEEKKIQGFPHVFYI
jgi:hypothetical protein